MYHIPINLKDESCKIKLDKIYKESENKTHQKVILILVIVATLVLVPLKK